ncbi:MAG TPA: electron transfer flavoprotein subunit alpha/FixB family protein [Acidobacteriota bacterium]|jgi:electron transfer flavoprotein alpha subunit
MGLLPSGPASHSRLASDNSRPLVLVLAECNGGDVEKVTFELLGDARKIATLLNGLVELVLVTSPMNSANAFRSLRPYLRERLHVVEHPRLERYSTSTYLQALESLMKHLNPRIIMLGATANGRDLGPRLAARLSMGYVPHCLTFKGGVEDRLEITRVTYGGRVHVQAVWPAEIPLIVTMKPGVADAPSREGSPAELTVQHHAVELHSDRVRVIQQLPADPKTQDIREAQRIVSGGRGVGGTEGFAVIQELADALNAAVGASRVVVDLGWIEYARQVGQTGKTVAPKLYMAVGISGASHHLMGMRSSERIVAVNIDKQAPIFSLSHLGVVGDLHQVLPRLTELIRKHKAEAKKSAEKNESVEV